MRNKLIRFYLDPLVQMVDTDIIGPKIQITQVSPLIFGGEDAGR